MSISLSTVQEQVKEEEEVPRNSRIVIQILSLFTDARLKNKINIPALDFNTIEIIFIKYKETLKIMFGENYPQTPPQIKLERALFDSLMSQSSTLDNWTEESQLCDVVADVYQNMRNYLEGHGLSKNGGSSENRDDHRRKDSKESSEEATKRKVMMNGCADNELTETKNLNRHFRSKLRQVYFDVVKDNFQPPQDAKWIENSFTLPRVGFEDIARVLKNQWFNAQVNKQMENGKFMHKIMKGMMSIKSKKLMVKYYHVMLAAVRDPDNFVKWKYQ